MNKRIYFFANFGNWNKLPFGGGEVGNRKTLELLRKAGFDVIPISKYERVNNHSFINSLVLLWRILKNVYNYLYILMTGRRGNSVVHIAGFYGTMIYFEYILVKLAKILNYKVVYEMRGGGADTFYKDFSCLYRFFFRITIKNADCIFSQGKENFSLLESIKKNCDIFYYPNYVMNGFFPKEYPMKTKSRFNFIYFGRISKSKNVDLVIDVFIKISQKINDVYLDFVGDCDDEDYLSLLKNKIKQGDVRDYVKIWPACNHERLKYHLKEKHFYIFPSQEPREGHSNALTEAMSWGVIPIATSHGFNKTVIGNEGLVVNNLSANDFVNVILSILERGVFEQLSLEVYERVQKLYIEDNVYSSIRQKYNILFASLLRP